MNYFTGKHLHSLLIAKGFSLRDASKAIGISPDELLSYFTYEKFEVQQLTKILEVLELGLLYKKEHHFSPDEKVEYLKSLVLYLVTVIKDLSKVVTSKATEPGCTHLIDDDISYLNSNLKLLLEAVNKRLYGI